MINKTILLLLPVFLCCTLWGQENQTFSSNEIHSGFYIKAGPVLPLEKYGEGQTLYEVNDGIRDSLVYPPAKIGASLNMGFLIYIGPSFANHKLRFGIDATFIDLWFNTSNPELPSGSDEDAYKYWYYYAGQKFGPVFTINPVDKLMIDLSYKLNAYISWHHDDWGKNLLQNEVSISIRYRIMVCSFLYNFGKVNYDDFSDLNPDRKIDNNTFRILVGLKF